MDPQQTPDNQHVTLPTPPPDPVVPVAQSSKKLLIIVIAILLIIAAAFVLVWLVYLNPSSQSKRLSNSFMHSITTGNVTQATDLTGDSAAKNYLTTSAGSVHGTYKLSNSQFSNGKGYYLYTLSGAADHYVRTIVDRDNGKRIVNSFVFSDTALTLVSSTSSLSDISPSDSSATQVTATTADTSGCLGASDFSSFSNLGGMGDPDPVLDRTYSIFLQLEFSPNVATYEPGDSPDPTTVFSDFKDFYAQDSNKKYVIELESSVNSASPDIALANQRNNLVESDLETISGIPASKITIEPVTNNTSGDSGGDAFYRQVQITLKSAPSCLPLD
jgi:hypothetical protein